MLAVRRTTALFASLTVVLLLHAALRGARACQATAPSLPSLSTASSSTRARARGAPNILAVSSKCASPQLLPYSAAELRKSATLHEFSDEPAAAVEGGGGRLTCGFDDAKEACAWYNVQSGGVRFSKARYESIFDLERFDCTSDRSFPFDDYFLLAGGEETLFPQTVAIETRIPCQFGNATLRFDIWMNKDDLTLRLCTISADSYFNCEEMPEWPTDASITTSIPASADPFRIRIELSGITSDTIVLMDSLRYEGQICELVNDSAEAGLQPQAPSRLSSALTPLTTRTASKVLSAASLTAVPLGTPSDAPPTARSTIATISSSSHSDSGDDEEKQHFRDADVLPSPVVVDDSDEADVCEALTCNFNEQHACMYTLAGVGSTLPWEHAHSFIGNRLTGVHQNSPDDYKRTGYLVVGRNHIDLSEEVFVVESVKFVLRKAVQLSFDLFIRSFGPQLRVGWHENVCIDSFDYCPYSSPPLSKHAYWQHDQRVFIPPGIRKIFFIAGRLGANNFVAVDNIHVRAEDGGVYCDTNE